MCRLNIVETKKKSHFFEVKYLLSLGFVESLTEDNGPNVGLVNLIKLKTWSLLTALNNSPSSQREGKASPGCVSFRP